ncbi:MAG: head decoration protein [Thalassospira sp.]|jgi:hypothetical protein|nr:head decoration protein [Thalassospira sp.]
MTLHVAGPRVAAFINFEVSQQFRETGMLKAGDVYLPGTVLGRQGVSDAISAVAGANTGNGTLDGVTVVAGKDVELGGYVLTAKTATKFAVVTPSGDALKDATVGTAYNSSHIGGFTITAGGTAFVEGDSFTVTVSQGNGEFTPIDPDADGGSQVAAAILFNDVDARSAAKKGVLITRLATVSQSRLIWPEGITDGQKAAAIADLASNHLLVK